MGVQRFWLKRERMQLQQTVQTQINILQFWQLQRQMAEQNVVALSHTGGARRTVVLQGKQRSCQADQLLDFSHRYCFLASSAAVFWSLNVVFSTKVNDGRGELVTPMSGHQAS